MSVGHPVSVHQYRFRCRLLILMGVLVATANWGGGCKSDPDEAIARYKEVYLYRSELQHHLPRGVRGEDSIRLAQTYVQRWLREQYQQELAFDSIPGLKDRIAFQLADYQRKLAILELERYLVDQHLDTTVTPEQANRYYLAHVIDFIALEPRFHVAYISLPLSEEVHLKPDTRRTVDTLSVLSEAEKRFRGRTRWEEGWVPADSLQEWRKYAPMYLQKGFDTPGQQMIRFLSPATTPDQVHYFRLKEWVRPGQALPLSAVASELYQRILDERRYELVQRYQAKFAQEIENLPDVQVY